MGPQAIVQLRIDLIRQHHHIGVPQYLGHSFQIFPLHHRAGGVIREGHDHQLGPGGDGRLQGVGAQAELVLLAAGHMDRNAAGQGGDGLVAHEAGLRDDHLIPGLDQGADAHVNGFAAAHRHQDLPYGVVPQAHAPLQIAADLGPQLL